MFFLKKKKIVLDCFTDDICVYTYHSIKKASAYFPKWWKSLPKTFDVIEGTQTIQQSTIKRCDGILSLYQKGYVLSAWSDIQIKSKDNTFEYYFAKVHENPNLELVSNHDKLSFGSQFDPKMHLKLMSPWLFREKTGCQFSWNPVLWNHPESWNDYTILPGVIDFKHQFATHINLFLEPNREKIFIEAGQPLVHIIPLTDKEVEFKCHLVETKDLEKLSKLSNYGSMNQNFKKIKDDLKQQSKCPFSKFIV